MEGNKEMSEYSVILIVDDDHNIVKYLSSLMKVEGFKALQAYDGKTALELVRSEKPDVMLLDVKLPDMDGMEVLRQTKDLDQDLTVILMTGYSETRGATRAIKAGAFEYLAKPFDTAEVVRVVTQGIVERNLRRQVKELSGQVQTKIHLQQLMGPSDIVARLISEVECVAESGFSVVIFGETGSGKELVARAIHEASPRSSCPFTPVDCGAIPETLLESELFGHEKGAFTGADIKKPGKFEITHGGTLFLDEVSNMPAGSQAKLLRVLQEKRVYRVGSTKSVEVDVRILVASNQNLHDLTESGAFRQDLFYRLNEFSISVPPLRERKEDIPYLAKRFLDTANAELKKSVKGFSESALNVLFNYNWPGNVRQLRSTIRRAALLAGDLITEKDLDLHRVGVPGLAFTPKVQGMPWKGVTLHKIVQQSVAAVEREVIGQALRYTGGNKAKAARLLGIDYKTIHEKVKKLGISESLTLGDDKKDDGSQAGSPQGWNHTDGLPETSSTPCS
jgi:DNA-binding NtrC family response regulator